MTLELGPKKSIKTVGYSGRVPGPLLRVKQGQRFTVDVENRTKIAEIVHWHGLMGSPVMDGAMEEGSPMIAPGATLRYALTAEPAGLRWYHTHTFAGKDMNRGQYTGQHGVLWVAPAQDAGRYDSEHFIVLEDWGARMMGGDDGTLMVAYDASSINGKMMGAGEPLRVRESERVMLHVLNASATDVHWVALAGHAFEVVALDGNALTKPVTVGMLRLAPAERVSAVVVMDTPGVWVLGEVRAHVREAGMGLVVEYAGAGGLARWEQPETLRWDYAVFGAGVGSDAAVKEIPLVFESKFHGHGAAETWTINGKAYPEVESPLLVKGERYRLKLVNKSKDDHPIHLHRHRFALAGGVLKDTVLVEAGTERAVELVADNPGDTLLHCHQQDHMDRGFMMVFKYA